MLTAQAAAGSGDDSYATIECAHVVIMHASSRPVRIVRSETAL
jgi:hypothetical protein